MDVLPFAEGLHERTIPAEVRKHPEFDLGIVAGKEDVPGLRNKTLADPTPIRGPDRDVLEVRLVA